MFLCQIICYNIYYFDYFTGMGKGLVGVFTRPASGVVDFASSSFQGIQRLVYFKNNISNMYL